MSAYQYPAAAPSYAQAPSADPTAVMGRRIAAVVIDFLLYMLIMAFVGPTPLSPLAEYVEVPDGIDNFCEIVRDAENVSSCVEIGDRAYFTDSDDVAVQIVVWVAVVLGYSALQGAAGITPGKAALGIKVVDERGQRPGFGKSLLRTVLWVADAAPWCLPLVGFITGLSTKGHRRVGDMAAKTFVVGKAHAGPVSVPGLATAATGGYPGAAGPYAAGQWGAPPPGAATGPPTAWGAPPPGQQPQGQQPPGWGSAPSGGYPAAGGPAGGPPAGAPGTPGAVPPGTPGAPGPTTGEHRPAPPAAGWAAPGGESASGPSGSTSPSPSPSPSPSSSPGTPADAPSTPSAQTSPSGPSSPSGPADSPPAGGAAPAGGSDTGDRPAGPGAGAPGTGGAPAAQPDPAPSPAAETTAPDTPAATAPAPSPSPSPGPAAGAGAPAPQAAPTTYNPQWDAARGTYIVWEPNRGKWLGWDEAAQEWKPL